MFLKKITLRKCDTGLDQRLKGEITAKFLRMSPGIGRVVYKYFEWFSWAFLILTVVTLFFVGQGIYFYILYGNCNGPNSDKFCIFDPLGTSKPNNEQICTIPQQYNNKTLTAPDFELIKNYSIDRGIYKGNTSSKVYFIEFGCYSCHYTAKAEPTVKKILDKYGDEIFYVYIDFPLSNSHETALISAQAAHCAAEQKMYWKYREYLFANQPKQYYDDLIKYAEEISLNITQFEDCLKSEKYKEEVAYDYLTGMNIGVSVTPTFFINNQTIIGAEDYSKFKKILDKELNKNFIKRLIN